MSGGLNLFDEEEEVVENKSPEKQKAAAELDPQMQTFTHELAETLADLELVVLDLEKDPKNNEKLNHAFRLFHNTKGSSAMMGLVTVKDIAHYCESLLDYARKGRIVLETEHVELVLNSLSALQEVLSCIQHTGKDSENRYFRLLADIVDKINLIEQDSTTATATEETENKVETIQKESVESEQIKVSRSVIDQMMLLVAEFMLLKNKIIFLKTRYKDRNFTDHCIELDQFSSKMQRNILKLRLSPVKPILNNMKRVVRNTSQAVGKEISFDISGEETLLDRSLLDKISDPLMHLIRNAIDHGIEDEESRTKLNKPPAGSVTLSAGYSAGEVYINVVDDGAGMDADRIKEVAIEREIITESEAATMSNADAYNLIFKPKFSSAETVTETSGRGVGMDVVRHVLEKVGGRIEIQTEKGIGTTFSLKLPLSLAIVDCLGFKVGDQSYAIPQLNIEEVLSIESAAVRDNIKTLESGSQILVVRESVVPILKMEQIVQKECTTMAMILVRFGKSRFILESGKILGPVSIVSQPLPPTFSQDAPFSGVTKQGDGSLLFQIDLGKLYEKIESTNTGKVRKKSNYNRGAAGVGQESTFMTSSDIRRLQQKTIYFQSGLHFCVPVQRAKRIIFIEHSEINQLQEGGTTFITLEGATIPLIWVEELILRRGRILAPNYSVLLFSNSGTTYGIPMTNFIGIERMPEQYSTDISERGVLGSTIINDNTVLTLDLPALAGMFRKDKEEAPKEIIKETKKTILCAEDDKFFMSELAASLKMEGYDLILCEDGLEAKQILGDREALKNIDFVVTDIEMPRMTGLALCRWIKANADTKHLPVVAYTAITTNEMRGKMKAAGALAFISKMAFEDLLSVVNAAINGHEVQTTDNTQYSERQVNNRIVSFKIGDTWFGLPMDVIKEVSPITASADIPEKDKWLGEITSFRGAMIPVLDLGCYFYGDGYEYVPVEQAVIEHESHTFALRVNKVGEVLLKHDLNVGDGLANATAEENRITPFIDSVYSHKGRVISLLSPTKLSTLCDKTKPIEVEGEAAS